MTKKSTVLNADLWISSDLAKEHVLFSQNLVGKIFLAKDIVALLALIFSMTCYWLLVCLNAR